MSGHDDFPDGGAAGATVQPLREFREHAAVVGPRGKTLIEEVGVPVCLNGGRLTLREREVVAMIAHGFTNDGIAGQLFLSTETVKAHMRHILQKTDASNRAHVIGLVLAFNRHKERLLGVAAVA